MRVSERIFFIPLLARLETQSWQREIFFYGEKPEKKRWWWTVLAGLLPIYVFHPLILHFIAILLSFILSEIMLLKKLKGGVRSWEDKPGKKGFTQGAKAQRVKFLFGSGFARLGTFVNFRYFRSFPRNKRDK